MKTDNRLFRLARLRILANRLLKNPDLDLGDREMINHFLRRSDHNKLAREIEIWEKIIMRMLRDLKEESQVSLDWHHMSQEIREMLEKKGIDPKDLDSPQTLRLSILVDEID